MNALDQLGDLVDRYDGEADIRRAIDWPWEGQLTMTLPDGRRVVFTADGCAQANCVARMLVRDAKATLAAKP